MMAITTFAARSSC